MGKLDQLNGVTDTFLTTKAAAAAAAAAENNRQDGPSELRSGTLVIRQDTSGKYPIVFHVQRPDNGETSFPARIWRKIADGLWSPLCRQQRDLHSAETIRRWIRTELTRLQTPKSERKGKAAEPAEQASSSTPAAGPSARTPTTSAVFDIVNRLWPIADGHPSAASFKEIELDSTFHNEAFDAWIACPNSQGPFQASNVNRHKTRIQNGYLFLVFNFAGAEFELRFRPRTGLNIDSQRSTRDLQRLYRLATDSNAKYENLAGLVTSFLNATVEEEAPRLLDQHVRCNFAMAATGPESPQLDDQSSVFLIKKGDGNRLPAVAEQALRAAVDDCMAHCRALANQRASVAMGWASARASDNTQAQAFSAVLNALASIERQHAGPRPTADEISDSPSSAQRQAELGFADAVRRQFALSQTAAEALQNGRVAKGVGIIAYEKPAKL